MTVVSSSGHSSAESVTLPAQSSGMPSSAAFASLMAGVASAIVLSTIAFTAADFLSNFGFGGVTLMRAQSTVNPNVLA